MRSSTRAIGGPITWVLLAWVLTQLCLVASGPLSVRLLGIGGRGELALAVATVLLCSQLGLLGLPAAITYYGAAGTTTVWRILKSVAGPVTLQVSVASGLAVLGYLALLRITGGPDVSPVRLVIVAAATATVILGRTCVSGLQTENRLRAFALTQPVPALGYAVALSVLLAAGVAAVTPVLALYLASWVIACSAAAALLQRSARRPATDTPPEPRAVLRFARRASVATASPTDQFGVDQLLVGALLGHVALGTYAVGLAFQSAALLPLLFLGGLAGPRVARLSTGLRLEEARRWLVIALAAGGAWAVVVHLTLPVVLPIAFGDGAAPAVPVAHTLAVAGTVLGLRAVGAVCLQAVDAPGVSTRVELISFAVMVCAVVLLGRRYGVEGAACGMVAAGVIACLQQVVALTSLRRALTARSA